MYFFGRHITEWDLWLSFPKLDHTRLTSPVRMPPYTASPQLPSGCPLSECVDLICLLLCVPQCTFGGQATLSGSQFSPSRFLGLNSGQVFFTHWSSSLAWIVESVIYFHKLNFWYDKSLQVQLVPSFRSSALPSFFEKCSHRSPGWPPTCYTAKDDLGLLILLPLLPKW